MVAVNDLKKKEYFIESWNKSPFADVQSGVVRYGEIEANYNKLEKRMTNHCIDEIVVNSNFANEQAIPGFFYNIELTSNKSAVEFIYEYAKDTVLQFGLTPIINTVQLPCPDIIKTQNIESKVETYVNKTNDTIQNNYPFYMAGALLVGIGASYLFFKTKKGKKL